MNQPKIYNLLPYCKDKLNLEISSCLKLNHLVAELPHLQAKLSGVRQVKKICRAH